MTNVFDKRNTKQRQELMALKLKDLENASSWYVWSIYRDSVSIHVEKIHTLLNDFDDKLDEKEPVVSKSNLICWEVETCERRQTLLFCVDSMLSVTNEVMKKQPSRYVTGWEECFAKLELR